MSIPAAMFLAANLLLLSTSETTRQSAVVRVGQTLYLPQVTIGHIVINPSITLVKADWEICTIKVRSNPKESVSKVVNLMFGSETEGFIAGNLKVRIECWGGKLSVEYYFQKLELAI